MPVLPNPFALQPMYSQSAEYRREELLRAIERAINSLTLQELEALYYDMSTKNYINTP